LAHRRCASQPPQNMAEWPESPAQRFIRGRGNDLRRTSSVGPFRPGVEPPSLVRSSSAPTFKPPGMVSPSGGRVADDVSLVRTSSAQRILDDRQRRGSLNDAGRAATLEPEIVCSPLSLGSPEQRLGLSPVAALIASTPPPSATSSPGSEEKPKKKKKKKQSYKDMMAAMTVRPNLPSMVFWLAPRSHCLSLYVAPVLLCADADLQENR
jgi:hypothetical protein